MTERIVIVLDFDADALVREIKRQTRDDDDDE